MFGFLAIFIGALSAVQSRINGQLSRDIHNGLAAALISFTTGWVILFVLVFGLKKEREGLFTIIRALKHRKLRYWEAMAGVMGGFFVSVQSITVPQIGVALFTISTVAGQTSASLLVDKIGLSPSGKKRVTLSRVFVATATLFSVAVAVFPDLRHSTFKFIPLFLSLLVGITIAFQQAINGRLNAVAKSPLATTWMNFATGGIVIFVALCFTLLRGGNIGPLPHNIWLYTGGSIGVIFVAVSAFIIKNLGVLNFILFSVTGQLIGAVLLDWLAPARVGALSGYLITGTLMTLLSIAFSRFYEARKA